MTRINLVPPQELHTKHLVAEYRELPRVFKLAEKAWGRGETSFPDRYTLGKGHVKFFYTRLGFCQLRFSQLVTEMVNRGYKPQHLDTPQIQVPNGWFSPWTPGQSDLDLNRQRISERKPK